MMDRVFHPHEQKILILGSQGVIAVSDKGMYFLNLTRCAH